MTANKTQPNSSSVADFVAGIENKRRHADTIRSLAIYEKVTGLPPVMWGPSIIGYGVSHYITPAGREGSVPAACFSPRKANMTYYVGNQFDEADSLYAALGKHKKSKACLYINALDDVDIEILIDIITRDFVATRDKTS